MKKLVVILSAILLVSSAHAVENTLTCQAQERLSSLSDENLLHWNYYVSRYKSASAIENRLFELGYGSDSFPIHARVGNCFVELHNQGILLAIESGRSYSLLEDQEFNLEIRSLEKASRKAKTEEEKANANSKLKEARQENVEKIQKVIDGLRASLSNCEC
ncbi:MAG: hypothetical protein IT286_01985 [Proteobacteria bacterium]|jgi:hypothetical protein|nr:hypothetical protein [Pseudomonadota bacterium]